MDKQNLNKQTVLEEVGVLVGAGELSLNELQAVYHQHAAAGQAQPQAVAQNVQNDSSAKASAISLSLYVVGTLIVCLGISLIIGQNWDDLNAPLRILCTAGIGALLYALGWMRAAKLPDVNKDFLSNSLLTIATVATIIGAWVVAYQSGIDIDKPGNDAVISMVISAVLIGMYWLLKRSLVPVVFAIATVLGAYYWAIGWLLYNASWRTSSLVYPLATVAAGLLVAGTGHLLRNRAVLSRLKPPLIEIGNFMALGGGYLLTYISVIGNSSLIFDILYPVMLALSVWLSVVVNSRAVLVAVALFLTGYIFEISWEYFAEVLTGSVAVLLAGIFVIGLAYGATRFAKRFLPKQ